MTTAGLSILLFLMMSPGAPAGRGYDELALRTRAVRPAAVRAAVRPTSSFRPRAVGKNLAAALPRRAAGGPIVTATGTGLPRRGRSGAQARLLAQRAADVSAIRNAAAKALRPARQGTPRTSVQPFGARVRGFRLSPPRVMPDGRVKVRATVPARKVEPR